MGLLKLLGLAMFSKSDDSFDVYGYIDDPKDDEDDYRPEDDCPTCHNDYYGNDGCYDNDDDDDDYDDYDYDDYDD